MGLDDHPALAGDDEGRWRHSAIVLGVSTQVADGRGSDRVGPAVAERLRAWGLDTESPIVIADGAPVGRTLVWASEHFDLILTTGGTGFSAADRTPQETRAQLHTELPGIPELIRAGLASPVDRALFHAAAGLLNGSLVINLPDAPQAVQRALDALSEVIPEILEQIASRHDRGGRRPARPLSADEAHEILQMPISQHDHSEHRDHDGEDATVVELPRPAEETDEDEE